MTRPVKTWVNTSKRSKVQAKAPAPIRDIMSFKNPDDRKDILAAKAIEAGDKEAFIQIWDRYRPWLVQKAFRMVNSYAEAEDISSDVLTKVYHKIMAGAYRPTYTLNSWIMFMFKNHMVDYSRTSRWKFAGSSVSIDNVISDSEGSETSFAETMRDHEASADSLTLDNEQRKAVNEALASLDESLSTVLGMYYGQQKDYQEISVELNMNLSTVKVHMMRAKQKVREFIIREYPELIRKESRSRTFDKLDTEEIKIDGQDFTLFFAA